MERQPLVPTQQTFSTVPLVQVSTVLNSAYVTPSLLLKQYTYLQGQFRFSSSKVDYHTNNNIICQLPSHFESDTLPMLDDLLSRHSAMFPPFYMFSMLCALLFSLVGSALPTFIGCIFMLFFNVERNRKLKQNLQNIIDQQNELNFKPMGLLLVLNPCGLIAKFDLGGCWHLDVLSNSSFVNNGTPNMKIHETVATNDANGRLFSSELPQCISDTFNLSQSEWSETVAELNEIYVSEIEMEERLVVKPIYGYLFACSFLFNLPILVTFPIPLIYYLIVLFFKIKKFKKANQEIIKSIIEERNERFFTPKGLELKLIVRQSVKSVSNTENILQICQH